MGILELNIAVENLTVAFYYEAKAGQPANCQMHYRTWNLYFPDVSH
jgi:hypothetical protein